MDMHFKIIIQSVRMQEKLLHMNDESQGYKVWKQFCSCFVGTVRTDAAIVTVLKVRVDVYAVYAEHITCI